MARRLATYAYDLRAGLAGQGLTAVEPAEGEPAYAGGNQGP
ncbi:hypothetical protein PUR28_05540 [Streptomyces sp. BE308]|nr:MULTISPECIES: hypothetical protein [unclassified Streptomyces]MEE1790248.1 hypothetical protein [Streptomyces sp. BE308]WRZ73147.1 hypothetical protein OG251_16755 [Streptomyces sp. NBC_01237]